LLAAPSNFEWKFKGEGGCRACPMRRVPPVIGPSSTSHQAPWEKTRSSWSSWIPASWIPEPKLGAWLRSEESGRPIPVPSWGRRGGREGRPWPVHHLIFLRNINPVSLKKSIHPRWRIFIIFNFTFFRFYKNMIKEKIIRTSPELL
jgi:hypothetical protein